MEILSNTLESVIEEWSDPGDYPNAVASRPLPSYQYIESVDGEVCIKLDAEDIQAMHECREDFLGNLDVDLPPEIQRVEWHAIKIEIKDGHTILVLTVAKFEASPDCGQDDPPDREDY